MGAKGSDSREGRVPPRHTVALIVVLGVLVSMMVFLSILGAVADAHFNFGVVIAAYASPATAVVGALGMVRKTKK